MIKRLVLSVVLLWAAAAFGQDLSPECSEQLPIHNAKLGDNWLLPGVIENSTPKFTLSVKNKKKMKMGEVNYKSGKKYSLQINAMKDVKIKELYITTTKLSGDEGCNLGIFKTSSKPKKASALSQTCQTVLSFNSSKKNGSKKVRGKWIAPHASGCDVLFSLTILGSDGKLYYDDIIELDELADKIQHKALTLVMKPKHKN